MMGNNTSNNKGQLLAEYAIYVGIIVIVVIAMSPMIRRASQGMIRMTADQIGTQENSDLSAHAQEEDGYLIKSVTNVYASTNTLLEEVTGDIIYTYDDETRMESNTRTNVGFTRDQ
jgi:uncharacterized protein (UPF0333 family)